MDTILKELIEFRNKRDWQKYHTPRNLAEAINVEAGELLQCFLWDQSICWDNVAAEIADVAIYLLYLCDSLGIDLKDVIKTKIATNALKYPEDKRHEW